MCLRFSGILCMADQAALLDLAGCATDAETLSRVPKRLDRGNHLDCRICRGASAPSASSTRRAGRLYADGGRIRYDSTICAVSGCLGRIFAKRTNFGIPNEINAVRFFPPRRSESGFRPIGVPRRLGGYAEPVVGPACWLYEACSVSWLAYGQRSAPVASTRERRHVCHAARERQGAFDS